MIVYLLPAVATCSFCLFDGILEFIPANVSQNLGKVSSTLVLNSLSRFSADGLKRGGVTRLRIGSIVVHGGLFLPLLSIRRG